MYYNKDINEIYKELETGKYGLTRKEAKARLEKYGKNELPQKKKESVFEIFISEFKDPMVILLLVAIVASLLVKEYIDEEVLRYIQENNLYR